MVKPVYFVMEVNPDWPHSGEELGPITFRQEIFCWVLALTNNGAKAVRHAYLRNSNAAVWEYAKRTRKRPAIKYRVEELREAHRLGFPNRLHPQGKMVNLEEGPWQHYGKFDEGFPIEHKPTATATREKAWNDFDRSK